MAEPPTESGQSESKKMLENDDDRLHNFDEFKERAKALSHIKVKRKTGDYFHHFVIDSIVEVPGESGCYDLVVTVGEYTSSGEICTANNQGIAQFVRKRILLGSDKKHDIFDFDKGVYLLKSEQYPNSGVGIHSAFVRFDAITDERKFELASNNCGHAVSYILTGKEKDDQADDAGRCKSGFIDFFDVAIVDCKEIGFKTALLVAGLGAIAGALVRRAYVRIIIAAIVSNATGSEMINCDHVFGSNLRDEAHKRIVVAEELIDINFVITNKSIKIVDNLKDHLETEYVCGIAEKLIKEAALMTVAASLFVAVCLETIIFLFYICCNLLSRRNRGALENRKLCRILFLCLFGGYGSIGVAVLSGYFAFLNFQRPAIAFFAIVTFACISSRYVLTVIAGQIFNACCFRRCWDCCPGCPADSIIMCCICIRPWRLSDISFIIVLVFILGGMICSLVFYFLK